MPYTPGPFDSAHVYLNWGGKLPGDEEWSCGVRLMKPAGAITNAEVIAALPAWSTALTDFHTAGGTKISPAAKLSFVKANIIAASGLYQEQASNELVLADLAGGWGGSTYPNQCTVVMTWTTGFSRGPAHAGRVYLPLPSATIAADGRMTVDDANSIDAQGQALRNALNDATTNAYQIAVFSRKLGAPAHRAITGVRVGRVIDTQRRRRRSLVEEYTLP